MFPDFTWKLCLWENWFKFFFSSVSFSWIHSHSVRSRVHRWHVTCVWLMGRHFCPWCSRLLCYHFYGKWPRDLRGSHRLPLRGETHWSCWHQGGCLCPKQGDWPWGSGKVVRWHLWESRTHPEVGNPQAPLLREATAQGAEGPTILGLQGGWHGDSVQILTSWRDSVLSQWRLLCLNK